MCWVLCNEWGSRVFALSPHPKPSRSSKRIKAKVPIAALQALGNTDPALLVPSYIASTAVTITQLGTAFLPFGTPIQLRVPSIPSCCAWSKAALTGQVLAPGAVCAVLCTLLRNINTLQCSKPWEGWKPHHMKTVWRNGGCFDWLRK